MAESSPALQKQEQPKSLEERIAELSDAVATLKAESAKNQVSIIMYSGDLDKMIAGLNIAVGAAGMGMNVSIFFTFWATSALRKTGPCDKRSFVERMFGWMLPTGVRGFKLSKMHMGGLGTAMMRHRMRKKGVPDCQRLFEMAAEMGVKFMVCEMSMDLLGIRMTDLIDHPQMEPCGVSTFLSNAMESKVTLFI